MKWPTGKFRVFLAFILIIVGVVVFLGGSVYVLKKVKYMVTRPRRYTPEINFPLRDGVRVFAASSLDRIFQDGKTLVKPTFTTKVELSLARNEYESFQVVLDSEARSVPGVELVIPDLVHENGTDRLSADDISWRVVGYVRTEKPYYPVKYVGKWPDPLLPGRPVDVEQGKIQPFWITVYAPPKTKAGLYRGRVTLQGLGLPPRVIPLTVRVYDFTLPVDGSLKTAFDFYPHITRTRYPQTDKEPDEGYQARIAELNDKYYIAMLKYRMNPLLNIDPTNQSELARVDRYRILGLNNFSVGRKGGTFNNNWPKTDEGIEDLLPLYRTYGEILNMNHFLPFTYIYTWDEGKIGNPRVPKICSMIHRAYEGLKNMVCYHGFWDPERRPDWGKDIDIWCFQIDDFDAPAIRKLRDHGVEVWVYPSGPSGYKNPNLAMDFDSLDYRILPWLCWKFDIEGILYWCVNWWVNVDPFKNARNTRWDQNANGLLFYPGEDGPLASLRLEIFRDGMEDYEYIQQLMMRLRSIRHQKDDPKYADYFEESKQLLMVDESIARSMNDYTRVEGPLMQRRHELAVKIEQFEEVRNAALPSQ